MAVTASPARASSSTTAAAVSTSASRPACGDALRSSVTIVPSSSSSTPRIFVPPMSRPAVAGTVALLDVDAVQAGFGGRTRPPLFLDVGVGRVEQRPHRREELVRGTPEVLDRI